METRRKIVIAACILFGINFATLFAELAYLGGDAANGKVENGRYFVGEHGHYSEVSQQAYEFNKAHVKAVLFGFPLVMCGSVLLLSWKSSRKPIDTRSLGEHSDGRS